MHRPATSPYTHVPTSEAHIVQFYTDDAYLVGSLSQFVCSALAAGEAVVVVATKDHRQRLKKSLHAAHIDLDRVIEEGRYTTMDAAETLEKFMAGPLPDAQKFDSIVGSILRKAQTVVPGQRVAVFGEMVALLTEKGNFDGAIRLEQLWNELSQRHFFYLRCAYPVRGFRGERKGEPYSRICAEHSRVIPAEY
jgi:hypothetical protein